MTFDQFKVAVADAAKKAGIQQFELYSSKSYSLELAAYKGEIDRYQNDTDFGVSLRCLHGGKMGYATTQTLSAEEAQALVQNALDSTEAVENTDIDEIYCPGENGYPKAEELPEVPGAYETLRDAVLGAEKTCLEYSGKIDSVSDSQADYYAETRAIYNSEGLDVADTYHRSMGVISPVAKDGENSYNEYEVCYGRVPGELNMDDAAKKACAATLSFIGAKPAETGSYPVLLCPEVACDIFSTFAGCFSGLAAVKGLTLLKDKVGEQIAADCLTLCDAPKHEKAILNRGFDDQGVPSFKKNIVKDGKLETLLHNLKTAGLLGAKTTANAYRGGYGSPIGVAPMVMYIAPSAMPKSEVVSSRKKVIEITDVKGLHAGANAVTGDFSLEAKGYLYENGKRLRPVSGITVAGNFYELLKDVAAVADDLTFDPPGGGSQFGAPSVLVDALSVSGA